MEKVFCIGMFKTGTSSIGRAFEILGYKTLNGPWWPQGIMIQDTFYVRPKEWIPYYNNIMSVVKNYDAFQDYPWMFLYDKLYESYPNAKFILTVRNAEDVAESDINMLIKLGHSKEKIHSKDKLINRYTVHRKKVLKYFEKKNNFIEIDIFKGEGWKKLCSFLNKDIPNIDFPHMNKKKI